ncbi:hypothetical protein [Salinibacter ruber]|uniref:Uncharacterized protein n=1 Tax=Salinibacter ruber TaxID=146919 RepID=A0A9X2ZZ38_9BACT|nr:hypothetical protein [Salinibacter ruber]MCS3612073.1 hypothetical protein [Salinibacter ruber]MCS3615630.1 hypothetical protein [Salinibacter ruber]MCS3646568.1 hypothetical protein [Salinibacter ruber]MCS3674141.1 hypothetical protein [Salinibacter ruber]MCS3783936.1 hypothetical protein [Salinibacter ruber]
MPSGWMGVFSSVSRAWTNTLSATSPCSCIRSPDSTLTSRCVPPTTPREMEPLR